MKKIEIESDFLEHLLNCLANQKYINEINADALDCDHKNIQKENQVVIDTAWKKGMDILQDNKIKPIKGNTSFGYYDDEKDFQKDCYRTINWVVKKLGHPILDIELSDIQYYTLFEEAINTYILIKNLPNNYSLIHDKGKFWIKKYFFAMCKDTLGNIRQKYKTIPVCDGEVTLDGKELKLEAMFDIRQLLKEVKGE